MNHKRSRCKEDKIIDAIEKIGNIHQSLIEEIKNELLLKTDININVVKCKKYIIEKLSIPEMGRHTINYWIARGWTKGESYIKSKEKKIKNQISPFSIEFWEQKINPKTNLMYTKDEADYKRNSIRPIRKEYWIKKGYSLIEAEYKAKEVKEKNNNNKILVDSEIKKYVSKRCKEYWIVRGYSEEETKEQISKIQTTFSLDICIEKYGEELGKQRWLDRQEKWHKNYKKTNFSKVSQKLFWSICGRLDSLEYIYFAELDDENKKDNSGKNNEIKLRLSRVLLPDFIDTKNKKIIEFDGTYWHGEVGRGNKLRDKEKDLIFKEGGYEVLHIKEQDYYENEENIIKLCLNFLKQ